MPAAKAPRATLAARKFLDGKLIVPSASMFPKYLPLSFREGNLFGNTPKTLSHSHSSFASFTFIGKQWIWSWLVPPMKYLSAPRKIYCATIAALACSPPTAYTLHCIGKRSVTKYELTLLLLGRRQNLLKWGLQKDRVMFEQCEYCKSRSRIPKYVLFHNWPVVRLWSMTWDDVSISLVEAQW